MAGAEAVQRVQLVRVGESGSTSAGTGTGVGPGAGAGAGAGGGLSSLARWLGADPELSGAVRTDSGTESRTGPGTESRTSPGTESRTSPGTESRTSPGTGADPTGHMGDALEIINLVVSNSLALVSVLTSVLNWRQSRPAAPEIRVILVDGRTLTVDQSTIDRLRADVTSAAPPTGADAEPPAAGDAR
ncbi:effector-associated constant component EACC1 [Streptomyces typhae]|uniref:effector-associated constant component EACC1 n=1 Tax=Streptomyces typhae TaxID=2681492 RepID=UPI0024840EBC|nr:hypothetical protein [Streptomyces typhae]